MTDLDYDVLSLNPNGTLVMYASVKNTGTTAVENATITLTAGGQELETQSISEALQPGQEEMYAISYQLPSDFVPGEITATVTAENDVDSSDNAASYTLPTMDVSVEDVTAMQMEELTEVAAYISNRGFADLTNITVHLRKDSPDGEELASTTVDRIAVKTGEIVSFEVDVPNDTVVYVVADDLELETTYSNNQGFTLTHENEEIAESKPDGEHEHNFQFVKTVAPTCNDAGYDIYRCDCGAEERQNEVAATGHSCKLQNAQAATCTKDGYTGDKVCTVCGKTVAAGEAVPAKGHTKVEIPAVAATCTKNGTTAGVKCSVCKEILLAPEKVPAKGHTWDNGKVTQKPTLTKEGIKTYTCTVCADTKTERIEKLTTCDAGEDCPTHNYKDVKFSQWYHLDVDYVVESGLMVGDGGGIFRPDNKLSRAEMVQILYNWAGKPEVTGSSKFSDVADGAWYAKPVIWAAENGVVNGVGNGKFAPNDPVTREQLVAMLYRYAEKPEVSNALTDFADANKISDYAVDAVKWAVEQDILRGDGSPRKLRPTDHAKRCEVAAMLHRYIG